MFLISRLAASLLLVQPATCHAAAASLPWDHTLLALQDMLISTVAPAVIRLAFTGAAILYALGGHDKQAGRLFEAGIGGCFALAAVHLLNYVLP
jgi:type IV secretory pathway VirB2 component (pilin)